MTTVVLSLELCEGRAYGGTRIVLFRDVDWPGVPPEGALVHFGRSVDGEEAGINARVVQVSWSATSIDVAALAENLGAEYDDVVANALRDGYQEWDAWQEARDAT